MLTTTPGNHVITPEIRRLTSRDIPSAARVLANSLIVEPGYIAIIPDDQERLRLLTTMYTGTLAHAIRCGSAWGAFHGALMLGVAEWLPPGAFPPKGVDIIRSLFVTIRMLTINMRATRALAAEDHASERYFPEAPVWYLQGLGVAPEAQGLGIGSKLIVPVISDADSRKEACYLETGTERNVRFYERFGFEILEPAAQLVADGPTHWTMIRYPQPVHT